ncbi:MAG: Lytic transglycosylase catalytic [Lacunisphaera sp.]|nr:Lytic transglycosylase catalytic [Lacunisphaera sp.]
MNRAFEAVAVLVVATTILLAACNRKSASDADPATREAVWTALQPHAARYRMEPAFIYALVAAESNFEPKAQNGEARGLLQLKPMAWRQVNPAPYEPAVWNWRQNLEVGVDYLAWCRSYLHQRQKFSYPLLLAAFHYGVDYVEQRGFDPGRIEPPDNAIYRELWRGNLTPVPPPKAQIPR